MPEPKNKYDQILAKLMDSIKARDGEGRLIELREELRERNREGTFREMIVQIISKEGWCARVKLLCFYPELIVPYLWRIKRPKS